jgi:hypothetical protein
MRRLVILVPLIVLGVTAGLGAAQAAPSSDGDRWALVIGIDHFQGATRPNTGAIGDAEDTRAALLAAGWAGDHIKTLTDANATAAGIRDGLAWLASKSTDTSFSVFAYSGHVKQVGSTESIWPHDNQFISDTDLAASLRSVKGYLWAHFSGCEAAGFDEKLSGPTRLVTAASQSNEKGYELSPELRNSVFTNLMVDKGLYRKQADANKDGKVSIQEAFRFAADQAPKLTAKEQYGPQHPYIAGGDGSEWFLERVAPAAASAAPPAAPAKHCILFICL